MSNQTYLFYDIETTGLNKCFDQVLQFAAIRTDHQLNEISREEMAVTLNCDVVPSPGAIMTHRMGVDQFSNGLSELEAIQKIHTLLNTPNTISVGYNSLGFDDEFLRFSFYKNLLPPYTHQYSNGCGRMDIYPITVLYYLFKPDHLIWPNTNDVVNFKLENLNANNNFFEGAAHNAMVDVEVTLALARKLLEDQSMWNFVIDYFNKKTDEARIGKNKVGLMVNGKIGNAAQFIAPVISLGQHQHYKNQSLWLRLDGENLSKTKSNAINETTKILKKRLGEPPIFLPLKERYVNLLSDDRKKIIEENKRWIEKNSDLFNAIEKFYQHEKYPEVPERDSDAALYDIGFPTPKEETLFRQFHAAKPEKKLSVAMQFPNSVRQEQAIRILARHFPDFLSDADRIKFDVYLHSQPVDFRGEKKLTIAQALIEIDALEKTKSLDAEQNKLLGELRKFLNNSHTSISTGVRDQ